MKDIKPTANTSMTWVHGNHTFKAGADMVLEGFPQQSSIRAYGEYSFSGAQTQNPAEYGVGGIIFPTGFAYASYLLGQVSSVETSAINDSRLGNHTFGAFVQDSWKVNRRLTLELGLRWDYATLLSEQYGRMSDADFQGVNPSLASPEFPGGRAGSIVYGATNGGKPLSNAYPFSLGPHLGVAYQITPEDCLPRRRVDRLLIVARQRLPVLQRGELLHRCLTRAIPPGESTVEWNSALRCSDSHVPGI